MSLAQIQTPPIPWPLTGNWVLGLIGVLAAVYLVLGVAGQCQKLFGKNPPLSDELLRIDRQARADLAQTAQDCERRHSTLRHEMDERLREIAVERTRNLGELHEKINAVAADVAFIRGKFSKEQNKD